MVWSKLQKKKKVHGEIVDSRALAGPRRAIDQSERSVRTRDINGQSERLAAVIAQ